MQVISPEKNNVYMRVENDRRIHCTHVSPSFMHCKTYCVVKR